MAKVELNYSIFLSAKDTSGNGGSILVGPVYDEYIDKIWLEGQTFTLINELVDKRKVLQRKLDAARKRFKRLTDRLNVIENNWAVNSL